MKQIFNPNPSKLPYFFEAYLTNGKKGKDQLRGYEIAVGHVTGATSRVQAFCEVAAHFGKGLFDTMIQLYPVTQVEKLHASKQFLICVKEAP